MKWLVALFAVVLTTGGVLAQDAGPSPQSGMDKPGMTNGAKPNGSMDTRGTSTAKGNVKRETDDAPATAKKDIRK